MNQLKSILGKMHIHSTSPNALLITEEDAATKIQAGFRGYRVRKQMRHNPNINEQSTNYGVRRVTSQNSLDKEKCATKIQARVRGFLVRRQQQIATDAATKIQAGFRGFRTRKQLRGQQN